MKEWKDIQGYEGLYQISNDGDVKSCDKIVICSDGCKRFIKSKLLKSFKQNSGYYFVDLTKNHNTKNFLIHRLVATAFINNPLKYKEVNHKDGNKGNNNVNNLEWCTASYNKKHMYDNLSSGKIKKEALSKQFKGKKLTEIHKLKIGDSHRGIKSVDSQSVKYLPTGEYFGSIRELCRIKNLPFSTIQKQLKNNDNRCCCVKISREDYFKNNDSISS